jgi:predicted  nucleic acid-binding Zn-ribbon protein
MQIAYLLGIPRSGTTLLSALLNQHPQIYCPPEPWTMLATSSLGSVPAAHPADSELIRQAVAGQLGHPSLHRDIAERIYREILADRSAEWLVDKTPRYYHCLDYIAETMPEAKYFWIVRNPLDVAASYLSTWNNDVVAALRDRVDHAIYFDFALGFRRLVRFAQDHDVHIVRYEELVQSPASVMSRVFAHLGVEPIELQQDIASGMQPLLASAFGDVKIAQTKTVHANSVDRYSETLGENNARLLCALLGRELMDALGYGQYYDRHDAGSIEGAATLPQQAHEQGIRLEKKRQSLTMRPYHYWQRQRQLAADYRVSLREAKHAPAINLAGEIAQLRDLVTSQSHQLASLVATVLGNQDEERAGCNSQQASSGDERLIQLLTTMMQNQNRDRDHSAAQSASAAGHLGEQIQWLEQKLAGLSAALDHQRASAQSSLDTKLVELRQSMNEHEREMENVKAQMEAGVAKEIEQLSQLERKIVSIQQSPLGHLLGWGRK